MSEVNKKGGVKYKNHRNRRNPEILKLFNSTSHPVRANPLPSSLKRKKRNTSHMERTVHASQPTPEAEKASEDPEDHKDQKGQTETKVTLPVTTETLQEQELSVLVIESPKDQNVGSPQISPVFGEVSERKEFSSIPTAGLKVPELSAGAVDSPQGVDISELSPLEESQGSGCPEEDLVSPCASDFSELSVDSTNRDSESPLNRPLFSEDKGTVTESEAVKGGEGVAEDFPLALQTSGSGFSLSEHVGCIGGSASKTVSISVGSMTDTTTAGLFSALSSASCSSLSETFSLQQEVLRASTEEDFGEENLLKDTEGKILVATQELLEKSTLLADLKESVQKAEGEVLVASEELKERQKKLEEKLAKLHSIEEENKKKSLELSESRELLSRLNLQIEGTKSENKRLLESVAEVEKRIDLGVSERSSMETGLAVASREVEEGKRKLKLLGSVNSQLRGKKH